MDEAALRNTLHVDYWKQLFIQTHLQLKSCLQSLLFSLQAYTATLRKQNEKAAVPGQGVQLKILSNSCEQHHLLFQVFFSNNQTKQKKKSPKQLSFRIAQSEGWITFGNKGCYVAT